jgi:Fe-S cluster biogenesis protein NfuA
MISKQEVQKVIDQIRPSLQMDGGDIELVDVKENVVEVKLKGACSHCPHAQMTLEYGVSAYLKKALPEIKDVKAV